MFRKVTDWMWQVKMRDNQWIIHRYHQNQWMNHWYQNKSWAPHMSYQNKSWVSHLGPANKPGGSGGSWKLVNLQQHSLDPPMISQLFSVFIGFLKENKRNSCERSKYKCYQQAVYSTCKIFTIKGAANFVRSWFWSSVCLRWLGETT